MTVVNVKDSTCTHYIGRGPSPQPRAIHVHLGNPFSIYGRGGRDGAIRKFERWAYKDKKMLAMIGELPENAILGCWCKPLPCHGDVIMRLWQEIREGKL